MSVHIFYFYHLQKLLQVFSFKNITLLASQPFLYSMAQFWTKSTH